MVTPISTPPSRILLGPGPSMTDPRVREALSRPPVGHLDLMGYSSQPQNVTRLLDARLPLLSA